MSFYKKFLSVFLTSLCCILACTANAQQNYPVLSTLQLTPPYSLYLNDYSTPGSQKMQVNLFLKDLTKNNYPCRLRIKIEGFGISVYSKPDFYAAPLYLNASEMRTVTGDELAVYLNPSNLIFQGISLSTFQNNGGKLPEGVYRITAEALDYFNKKVVSNAGSTVLAAYLSYPPIINLPLPNSKVAALDPQNVLFQWTPRHTGSVNAAYNVAYKFSLVPIIPPVTDPNVAVQSTPAIYETFTDQIFLAYGAAEPALDKGSSYAVKVQAVEAEGKDIFLNGGNSEVLKFTYGNACETPFNILAELASASSLKVSWTAWPGQDAFMIRIRKANAPNAAWFEYPVSQPEYVLSGLMPGHTYEYQVKGNCASGNGNYSELQWFQIPAEEMTSGNLVCGAPAENISGLDNDALSSLRTGMFFFAGTFPVTVTEVSGGNGVFSGKGTVGIPFLNASKFFVTFTDVSINSNLKLINGKVSISAQSLDQSVDQLIAELTILPDENTGEVTAIDNNGLPNIINVSISEPAVLPVYHPAANTVTFPAVLPSGNAKPITIKLAGSQPPYVFQDKNGETYEVAKNGAGAVTVTRREKKPMSDMLAGGSRTSHPISASKARVTFSPLPNDAQNCGFDKFKSSLKDNSKYTESYTAANESPASDSRISWKSVESGRGDRVTAVLENNDPSITAAGLVFKNGQGELISTAGPSGNTFTIDMIGAPEGNDKEIYAYHAVGEAKDAGLYLGKLNVASFKGITKKVVIVPVNGAGANLDAVQIQAELNKIYKQAVVKWEVELANNFTSSGWDTNNDGSLEAGNSNELSAYTAEQRTLASLYKKSNSLEKDKYYVFIVGKFSVSDQEGYMVRSGQVGFVKEGSKLLPTLAHELGHGAFSLKHSWEEFGAEIKGTTANLMDYSGGTELWYRQWNYIRNPDLVFTPFEGDDDGAYQTDGHYSTVYLVSLMLGMEDSKAKELAKATEAPDTEIHSDIDFELDQTWAYPSDQISVHSLTGGFHSSEELMTAFKFLLTDKNSIKELGKLLHRFGDTYAHTRLDNLNPESLTISSLSEVLPICWTTVK